MNIDLYSILSQQDKDTVCDIVNETIAEHYGEDAVNDFDTVRGSGSRTREQASFR